MRRLILPLALLFAATVLVSALFDNPDRSDGGLPVVAADGSGPNAYVCTPVAQPASRSVSAPTMMAALTAMPPIQPLTSGDSAPPSLSSGDETINDPVVQDSADPYVDPMPTPVVNFEGIQNFNFNQLAPDSNIAVGPNHIIQLVNASFKITPKVGTQTFGPYSINMLWQGFDPAGRCHTNHVDPIVLYDTAAARWVIATIQKDGSDRLTNRLCIAVSDGPDPLLSRYHRYLFEPVHPDVKLDYPKVGIWPDAYYASAVNVRYDANNNSAIIGSSAIALQRDALLTGREGRYQACVESHDPDAKIITLLPSDMEGSSLYHNLPPPPSPPFNYLYQPNIYATLGDTTSNTNTLKLYNFHVNWANPSEVSFTGPIDVTTASFDPSICPNPGGQCVPQPSIGGTSSPNLRTQSHRLMYRLAYRNMGGYQSLLTNHTVKVAQPSQRTGIRWYELRDVHSQTPSVHQQSTYAPADGVWRWMGSIAMDWRANIALGYSASGPNLRPSIRYTGRNFGDTNNELRQEQTLITGGGVQTYSNGNWGDYTRMAVDPLDDCTFWYTNEYYASTSQTGWNTRIGAFRSEACTADQCDVSFRDVHSSHFFYSFIRCLACRGVVSGYRDDTFRPDNNLTRGQLAKFVANSAFFSEKPATQTFSDVAPDNPFYIWIEQIARRGIVSGYECGEPNEPCDSRNRPYFRWGTGATRGQIAKIVSNTANFQENIPSGPPTFTDVSNTHPFWVYIERIARRGIISGYADGTYKAFNPVTRGQMAKIAANTFFPSCHTPGDPTPGPVLGGMAPTPTATVGMPAPVATVEPMGTPEVIIPPAVPTAGP